MIKISDASYENKIHRVDSSFSFNEDSKNILFCQGGPISGEGQPENLVKMAKN